MDQQETKITKIAPIAYTPDDTMPMAFFENNHFSPSVSYIIDGAKREINTIDTQKIANLRQLLLGNIDIILDAWISSEELRNILSVFILSESDTDYFIRFFGNKILLFLVNSVFENKPDLENTFFFTTKFLSFVKTHDIKIDTLHSLVITLKSATFLYLKSELETYKAINAAFDIVATILSKNFSDIVLRLLGEYRNAIDESNIISKTDIFGNITYVNQAFCDVSGYSKDELIGKSHNVVRHPDNSREIFTDLWNTITQKKIWRGIIKNRSKDGSGRWFQSTIVPIVDENENILEYISIRTDITNLKNALKNAEEYNYALNSSNLIIHFLPGGNISYVNSAFCKLIGYSEEELLSKNIMHEAGILYFTEAEESEWTDESRSLESIREHVLQGNVWQGVIRYITKYKTNIWCAATIIPILDFDNKITEYIVAQTDITDIEISKQNLRRSYERLQILDKQKDEFLNIASHELRTPITSIRGYISMIVDGDTGDVNPETKQYLERVLASSTRLLTLINDMLDIAKLEAWKHEFDEENVEIREFINDCFAETAQLFKQKRQICTIDVAFERLVIKTDRNRLLQVMINLLGNANKFTPEEWRIRIDAKINGNSLEIRIIDSGIGIKKTDLENIFEKFNQARWSLTRNTWGTWLGLPIAKQIIERMWWKISVTSEPGHGSSFLVELPIIENELISGSE